MVLVKIRIFFVYLFRSIETITFRKKALRELRGMESSREHKNALVIANGPSVNKLDFGLVKELKDSNSLDVFAVNSFFKSKQIANLGPNFIVLSDPVTCIDYKSYENQNLWEHIESMAQTKIFVPLSWSRKLAGRTNLLSKIVYFENSTLVGLTKNIKPDRATGYIGLTAYHAVALASFLGYEKIFIIGFDNNMFLKLKNDQENRISQDSHHMVADYEESHDLGYLYANGVADYFYNVSNLFYYLKLFRKPVIINLDPDSLVDVFPKGSLPTQNYPNTQDRRY
jgi:hypothetical protein